MTSEKVMQKASPENKNGFTAAMKNFFRRFAAGCRTALRVFCGWFGFGVFGGSSNKRRKRCFST